MEDLENIYNTEFYCSDLNRTVTVKDYLKELLLTLWKKGEGFSGKRPFGNSRWTGELAILLIEAKALQGFVKWDDSNTYIQDFDYDEEEYYDLVIKLIEGL